MKKFSVIVADPPWEFSDKLQHSDVKRGSQANYDTMTMQEIQELPIEKVCNTTGAVLCLWVPGSLLQDGLDTMKAWGFEHKQVYVWVKTKKEPLETIMSLIKPTGVTLSNIKDYLKQTFHLLKNANMASILAFGMGRLFRQTHEICLIGTRGKIYTRLANKSQRSVSFAENLKHSAKPEHLQDSLEIMFPRTRKLELFARRIRPGWTCLGNEIDGKDIRDALADL